MVHKQVRTPHAPKFLNRNCTYDNCLSILIDNFHMCVSLAMKNVQSELKPKVIRVETIYTTYDA